MLLGPLVPQVTLGMLVQLVLKETPVPLGPLVHKVLLEPQDYKVPQVLLVPVGHKVTLV